MLVFSLGGFWVVGCVFGLAVFFFLGGCYNTDFALFVEFLVLNCLVC